MGSDLRSLAIPIYIILRRYISMIDKLKIIIDKIFKDKKKLRMLIIICILIIFTVS